MRAILCTRLPLAGVLAANLLFVAAAHATMKVYYDPATGNIAFDTTGTRSGGVFTYAFQVDTRPDWMPTEDWAFRYENLIRLSTNTLPTQTWDTIGDTIATAPWQGLYTIGDVFPVNLSEDFWTTKLVTSFYTKKGAVSFGYVDIIGGGFPPDAEFIYGRPSGEFANRWDLVDPDSLAWASTAKLVYRPWSGEVLIDTLGPGGGHIAAVWLQSDGAFEPSGFSTTIGGPLNDATEDDVFILADAVEPGRYSLGQILPAGLTPAEYNSLFTSARYLGRTAFNGLSLDFAGDGMAMLLAYAAVPEPCSLVLLSTATLVAVGYLRRRR